MLVLWVTRLSLVSHLHKKSGYDPDVKQGWMVPMTVVVPGESALTWDFSQTCSLPKSILDLAHVSGTWVMDLEINRDIVLITSAAGGEGKVEANAKGPLALLVNLHAATSRVTISAEASRALLHSRQQNTTVSDASSLIIQTEGQNERHMYQYIFIQICTCGFPK